MAIVQKLTFNKTQLKRFAKLFRAARLQAGLTQLEVAKQAFGYEVSHCKVSRIERAAMPTVDAHCLSRMATVLKVPRAALNAVDNRYPAKASVTRLATDKGFWTARAKLTGTFAQ